MIPIVLDETDDENSTGDETDKCDDECTLSADGPDDNNIDGDDDDDKTGNDTLSVVVLKIVLDVLLGFIWDLGVGRVGFGNTSRWGVLSNGARFVFV